MKNLEQRKGDIVEFLPCDVPRSAGARMCCLFHNGGLCRNSQIIYRQSFSCSVYSSTRLFFSLHTGCVTQLRDWVIFFLVVECRRCMKNVRRHTSSATAELNDIYDIWRCHRSRIQIKERCANLWRKVKRRGDSLQKLMFKRHLQ